MCSSRDLAYGLQNRRWTLDTIKPLKGDRFKNNQKQRNVDMMKRISMGLLAILLVLTFIGPVWAFEKGNKRKGKYTYRKVYKACMQRGEVDSSRPVLSPDAKTRAQWTRVFEKKDFGQFGCQQEWETLSEEDLGDIYSYLWEHAADSPTPAKCK